MVGSRGQLKDEEQEETMRLSVSSKCTRRQRLRPASSRRNVRRICIGSVVATMLFPTHGFQSPWLEGSFALSSSLLDHRQSASTTTTSTITMSLADLQMQQQKATPATMFLNPSSSALVSVARTLSSSKSDRRSKVKSTTNVGTQVKERESDSSSSQLFFTPTPQHLTYKRQARGVLGFDIFPMERKDKISPSSSIAVSRQSNVDLSTWNVDFDSPGFPSTIGLPTTLRPGTTGALAAAAVSAQGLPIWFPWIPSKSQIESLKVSELKGACAQRRLRKSGNKRELQERLWSWTIQQQRAHQERLTEDQRRWYGTMDMDVLMTSTQKVKPSSRGTSTMSSSQSSASAPTGSDRSKNPSSPNSLAEWTRTVDLKPLLDRREKIRRDKRQGRRPGMSKNNSFGHKSTNSKSKSFKKKQNKKEFLTSLAKAVQAPSSPYSSNVKVKELYYASKEADQLGERGIAKQLLKTLLKLTPNDARIYRRLARMASEEGDTGAARATLQQGCRRLPMNGYLWHGLGQLELKQGAEHQARTYFQKAMSVDPTLPHPYHALGTLEHTQGRIADAMRVLKRGITYCPSNHRLHHALGDLYRDAKLLDDAERSYRRALEYGPPVSHCFAYSALAYVAYDKGNIDECRYWLRKSVALNDGRHAQGWVSLAQMEESEGNIDTARSVCIAAITQYERGLIQMKQRFKKSFNNKRKRILNDEVGRGLHQLESSTLDISKNDTLAASLLHDPVELKNKLLKSVPRYRSGDRFLKLYRNWARLEERYGSFETVDEVYGRASVAFPYEYKLTLDWAMYHTSIRNRDRARVLFIEACTKASNRHADPFRQYAEFEMSLGNYIEARNILYRGAVSISDSSDGGLGNRRGLAELFHTWAVCEWHLDNTSRADVLFDHALRLTESGEKGSRLRSFILYSIARLEFFRGELHLAQHCIGLCLKENLIPGGNAKVWDLWADVAAEMGNECLADQCEEQAELARHHEDDNGEAGLSRLLTSRSSGLSSSDLSRLKGPEMQQWMRRDPWHHQLFGNRPSKHSANFFSGVKFPRRGDRDVSTHKDSFLNP